MNQKTRQIIIAIAFVGAVIYALGEFTGDAKTERPLDSEPAATSATQQPLTSGSVVIDIEKYKNMSWGRDPFYRNMGRQKTESAPAPPVKWTLNGILFNSKSPSAVINKRVVRSGDRINGARVVKIEKRHVTLEKDGAQIVLQIKKETS